MICLNKAAYNHRRNYPWVIFHTLPISEREKEEARIIAAPANVTFVRDSPPIDEAMKQLSKDEYDNLISRCRCCQKVNPDSGCCKNPNREIYWDFWCYEEKTGWVTLSYAWQAAFRSYPLWTQPALKPYKYMVWVDDDAMPTKPWLQDPLKPMVEEGLVIFYDNFPQGWVRSPEIIEKMEMAYNNKSLCYIHPIEKWKGPNTGKFVVRPCKPNKKTGKMNLERIGLVHG